MKDCLLFFVKYPEPGTVKTRLANDASPELSAEFYATFVEEKFEELVTGCTCDVIVCFAPEKAGQAMRDWLGEEHRFIGQKGADLGRRMENGFREAFLMGYDRVVVTGSDIPGLTPAIIHEGLEALTPENCSLGPADDGGYYLIGFHRKGFVADVFKRMEWSHDMVLQKTMNILEEAGREIFQLVPLEDTDTIEDVETLAALGQSSGFGPRSLAMARRLAGM